MTEDEMVGWHHQPNGHEFEQAPGVGDGQGSLACCSPWSRTREVPCSALKGETVPDNFLRFGFSFLGSERDLGD